MSDENRTSPIITAFVVGGIIGAALGILFAPSNGRVTRAKLKDWFEETAEKASEEFKNKKEQLAHAFKKQEN